MSKDAHAASKAIPRQCLSGLRPRARVVGLIFMIYG